MKTLRTYRHGPAKKNEEVIIDGEKVDVVGGRASDSPLSIPKGPEAARRVGRRWRYLQEQGLLVPEKIIFVASTAKRAIDTISTAMAEAGLTGDIIEFEDLEEFDQGGWTGLRKDREVTLPDGMRATYVPPHDRDQDYAVGGTETLRGATARTMRIMRAIADITPEGGTALIGGHGITTRLAVNEVAGVDILRTKMDYGAETPFVIDDSGQWSVPYAGLPTREPNAPIDQAIWQA